MIQDAPPRDLAELAHELRTPLAAIMGLADAMRERAFGPLSDTYAEHAGVIHEAGRHMLGLIDALADSGALSLETFEANAAVASALRLTGRGAAISAELAGAPMIRADRRALTQIVLNLVGNAVKFGDAGGVVRVSSRAEGDDFVLVVEDDALAIGADSPTKGSGLGLPLVRRLCELHAGALALETGPDAKTRATVRLPVIRAAP